MALEETTDLTSAECEATMKHFFMQSLENLLHDILFEVHQEEKLARMQTAVVEVEVRAEKLGKSLANPEESGGETQDNEPVETKAATASPGNIQLKGNPMTTVKQIICTTCRLPRLLYPRVGFNSRPPPDLGQQYCKSEPVIILDKHDVHGQRKKGVKVKGQAKGKNKKGSKNDPASPVSNNSDPLTPSSSMLDSFEFKEIDFPAAKCPNRNSHLGDHWKAVNLFATHLNGSCWLRRDRAAGREANAKINSTPKDSRANSPKPTAVNGTLKRKAEDDAGSSSGTNKKKQKLTLTGPPTDLKKSAKKSLPGNPSKLREETSNLSPDEKEDSASPEKKDKTKIKAENADTIQVTPKTGTSTTREMSAESAVTTASAGKLKFNSPGGLKSKGKTKK